MVTNAVIIKSNSSGLVFILDGMIPFPEVCVALEQKLNSSKAFFKGARLAISFKGRALSEEEQTTLVDIIVKYGGFQVICVLDEQGEQSEAYEEQIIKKLEDQKFSEDQYFYRGTVHAGEKIERDTSIVIMGDVNPGATVISKGNIVVFGSCMGTVNAGSSGNQDVFIAALILKPNIMRIADKGMRSALQKKEDLGEYPIEPKVAFILEDRMVINTITQKKIGDYFAGV